MQLSDNLKFEYTRFHYEACNHGSFIVNYKSGRREMGEGKEGRNIKREKGKNGER